MVYQHLFGYNFALAFTCTAVFVALGRRRDRLTAIAVAALLVAALFSDGALALVGLVFAVVVVVLVWPFRLALLALVPAVVAHGAWYVLDHSEVLVHGTCQNCRSFTFTAPLGDRVDFGYAIFMRSAGGLVSGSVTAGAVALGLATLCVVVGLCLHRLSRPVVASLVGGTAAAVAAVASVSYSRAGFWHTIDEGIASLSGPSNRYVQPAAIFLMLAFAPAIAATIKPVNRRFAAVVATVAAVGLVLVFSSNLSSIDTTRRFYESWGNQVETQVRQAVSVISAGCDPGSRLDRSAQPVDASFQISVGLLKELLARGDLTKQFGRPAPPAMRAKICVPA
jgi:hypothetical protein